MPRRKRLRKIVAPPGFRGYKPYGASNASAEVVELLYEEYEAIKLVDYDLMDHKQASELMGISRPTLARIYESARRKIAEAFVEVKEIKTIYGNALMDENWFVCNKCNARFTMPKLLFIRPCPVCKSINIELLNKLKEQDINHFEIIKDSRKTRTVITSAGNELTSLFDRRFGRAAWFCLYDEASKETTFFENENVIASSEAGTKAADKFIKLNVEKVISGDFGSGAKELLDKAHIQLVILQDDNITVLDIISRLAVR